MIRLNDILDAVVSYHPEANLEIIEKAYVFSAKAHHGQIRLNGEPYLMHPLEVTAILTKLHLDEASVATGLLHDTVEDTYATLDQIEDAFGKEIAALVDGVTKISRISFGTHEEQQAENFRKMIIAMAKDIRVILIKLADRVHNMRTLTFISAEKQIEIATETLDIYAPLANRLGIYWVKGELEDLSLLYLEPDIYHDLEKKVAAKKKEREKYVVEVIRIINEKMGQFGIRAEVSGRPKYYYSIFYKMEQESLEFDQIYDLVAFRIIVPTLKDCYEALGIIHSIWTPVPGRFKDYINLPKANMYQSLHTTVIGPYGQRIEIQIRTEEMHRIAEYGIAAHWKYKEGKTLDLVDDKRFAWLRQLLEWQKDLKDPREFLETVRVDLFPDEVYVFTPKGDVKEFPRGATPIDFAYSIHTDIGHHCVGAKVNGRLVPLKYQLKNGDSIEILTSSRQTPSKDWLKVVKTPRARTKIRSWIKTEERAKSIALGREICEKEFKKYSLDFAKLAKSDSFHHMMREMEIKEMDDLYASIGYGRLSAKHLLHRFVPAEQLEEKPSKESKIKEFAKRLTKHSESGITIKGIDNVLVRFAKCCNPLPGDKVVGYITRGRGVTIHAYDCPLLLGSEPERKVDAQWDLSFRITAPAKIRVVSVDKKGLLADISTSIAAEEGNISNARIHTTPDKQAVNIFEIEVNNLEHLQKIIKSIEKVKGVISIERMRA
jgi:GTP pyrophosphokinase